MECFSLAFKRAVVDALGSGTPVFASIAKRGDSFMDEIKSRKDVALHEVTTGNRDLLTAIIAEELGSILHRIS